MASEGGAREARTAIEPRFRAGTRLAGRYRITRFVAQGGMGEVYEAEDLDLRTQVAVKVLRQDLSGDPVVLERFKQEINLARRVTHPNVCRIYDLGRHEAEGGGCLFLSMELLDGETLADRLHREGPPSLAAALAIVTQVAEALGAAHQADVVHRDLKSANVMLIPDPHVEGGLRAVVTDFGLAQASALAPGDARPVPGALTGTPAYMAPEQVKGHEVGFPADIYALGVVMYELVTGRLPFREARPIDTALLRLKEPPPPPRTWVPELPGAWEAAILRCLALRPGDRFIDVREVPAALQPGAGAPATRQRRTGRWVAAGLALLLGTGGVLGYVTGRRSAERAKGPRRSLAILGFENLSGQPEAAWLSTALSEMLRTELSQGEGVRMFSSEAVMRARRELGLRSADVKGKETLGRIRDNLQADLTLSGSYLQEGPLVRVDLRVQDTATGEVVAALGESAPSGQFIDLVERVGRQLRSRLGLPGTGEGPKAMPTDPEAARHYAQGLAKLLAWDAVGARADLEVAVRRAPDFPLAHAALAEALAALGYDALAKEAAQRAFERSQFLPREQRWLVEVQYRLCEKAWDKAADILATLWTAHPDTPEYGLRWVSALTSGHHLKEAQVALAQLRTRAQLASDPRLDLVEAQLAGDQGDYRAQSAAARRALDRARTKGLTFLEAAALLEQGSALRRLGDRGGSRAALEEAQRIYGALGDRGGRARSNTSLGSLAYSEAQYAKAAACYREAVTEFQAIGNRRGEAAALNGLGNALADQGQYPEALAAYEASLTSRDEVGDRAGGAKTKNNLAILFKQQGRFEESRSNYEAYLNLSREAGDKQGQADALTNLGLLHRALGNLPQAVHDSTEALALFRRIGEHNGISLILCNLAQMKVEQGDLKGARSHGEEAYALSRGGAAPHGEALALMVLGLVFQEEGRLPEARRHMEEALAIQRRLGAAFVVDETLTLLGVLALEEGRPAVALARLREAAKDYAKGHRTMDLRLIQPYVALAEVDLGQPGRGRATLDANAGPGALPPAGKVRHGWVEGRLLLAQGRAGEALAKLTPIEQEARRRGFLPLVFRIQLAQVEAESLLGNRAAAGALRERLAKEAEAAGFMGLARRAREAR